VTCKVIEGHELCRLACSLTNPNPNAESADLKQGKLFFDSNQWMFYFSDFSAIDKDDSDILIE